MKPATQAWLEGLREAAAETPRATASPTPDDPAALAAERAILAAHLATWIDVVPVLLAARRAFARAAGPAADPEAAIVLTTSPAGLQVARELLATDGPLVRELRPRIAVATERDYRAWCMRHPDESHLLHVNHWSWIKTRVPPQRNAEFTGHPRTPGERYWLHRTGTVGAGAADGRAAHLWKFNGRHAALLQAFVGEGRVTPGE